MKKTLLSLALLAGLSANAQLADGSIAPNWTFNDRAGVSHTLYDYLDNGYTVIIDISAAWCGPCWNYHNTHALETFYAAHGPAGNADVSASTTDDAMVFFVEGELQNTDAQITGTSVGTGATYSQGNWTTGTIYPIIDLPSNSAGSTFLSGYEIGYFPTIYKICPNRVITEVGQATDAQLYSSVGTCPAPASNVSDAAALNMASNEICANTSYTPTVQIQNNGTSALTNATITITQNGTTVSTGTFSGNLATYDVANVTCSAIANPAGGALVATVTTTGDASSTNNAVTATLTIAPVATDIPATVKIATDAFGSETTWTVKKSNGATVASGGPYSDHGSGNTATPGTYPEADVNFNLSPSECYIVTLNDGYGDGFTGQYGSGYLKVTVAGSNVVSITSFSNLYVTSKKMGTNADLGVSETTVEDLVIYPNPASGVVNVEFTAKGGDYTVAIVDVTGRQLIGKTITAAKGTQTVALPVDQLASGNYIVTIKTDGGLTTSHIVVE